jgi:hypothetical protein
MKKRKPICTTVNEIVEYWETRVSETKLSVDFNKAKVRCWRCGYKSKLQKCHIIPDSLGGKDTPSNLVLLCRRCHIEAPNIDDPEFFWDWLKAQAVPIYNTYWTIRGMKEYEEIYHETIETSCERLGIKSEEFTELLKNGERKTIVHFGEGRINPSTIAGMFRNIIKDKERQLELNTKTKDSIN